MSVVLEHLPILVEEDLGNKRGFFNRRPYELAEIVLSQPITRSTPSALEQEMPQEESVQKRGPIYALGRTRGGDLIMSYHVDDKREVAEQGQILPRKDINTYARLFLYGTKVPKVGF